MFAETLITYNLFRLFLLSEASSVGGLATVGKPTDADDDDDGFPRAHGARSPGPGQWPQGPTRGIPWAPTSGPMGCLNRCPFKAIRSGCNIDLNAGPQRSMCPKAFWGAVLWLRGAVHQVQIHWPMGPRAPGPGGRMGFEHQGLFWAPGGS